MRASEILPAGIPFVPLVHATDPGVPVLVPTTCLVELAAEEESVRSTHLANAGGSFVSCPVEAAVVSLPCSLVGLW
jgi:hypothetical protein